jgi:tetratricopeptide (TPR) repeat protein
MAIADEHFRTGIYDEALRHYSRALRFNRDLAGAWVGQIRCLIATGDYNEAVTWSDRGLERFANTPDLLACKGLALTHLGDPSGPSYLDSAVTMKAISPWVWLARGECLLLRKSAPNAERCFLKALESAGDDWHTELCIGIAYNAAKMHAKARKPLLSVIERAPDNPLALYQLGLMHEGSGELALAEGCFQRALTRRGDYRDARAALDRVQKAGVASRIVQKLWQKL